jgi:CRISPR-associated protein (TIGR03986 family)
MEVTALNPDPQGNAWLVMTGNTGAKDRAKYRAFVFVGNSSATDIILTPEEIAEFKFINQDGGNADTKHWNDTWRHFQTSGYGDDLPVRQGGRIPIFYIDDTTGRGGIQMGLASMFKLAHAQSPKDLLRNSDPDHLNKDKADLASLIFGSEANDRGDRGLKRRVAFDMALPPETDRKHRFDQPNTEIKSAVLLSPKPSYFPIYVRQAPGGQSGQARAAVYATYTPLNPKKDDKNVTPLHEAPELAGVKIWPAGLYPGRRAHAPYLEHDELTKIATTLHPLPAGSLFMTTARFHNLRPVELGAVLWALSFGMRPSEGDVQPPRHRLGMGKPLGLGEVSIRMVKLSARTLGGHTDAEAGRYVEAFEKEMRTQYAAVSAGADWSESAQVAALRKAAMPPAETARVQDRRWNGRPWIVNQSDYMELNPKAKDHFGKVGWNDFQEAKNKGEFLPPYVPGAHELVKHEHSGSAIQSGYDVAAKVDSKSGPRKGAAVRVKTTGAEGIISGDQRPDGKWPLDLGPNGKTALSIGQFELIGQSSTF